MPWFKVDDGWWSHPKTLQLSDSAQALWVRAGSWSMKHLTDGSIPGYALSVIRAKPRFSAELVAVGLWDVSDDGFAFHDWTKYQPSKDQVENDRSAAAERQRAFREKSRDMSRRDSAVTNGERSPSPTQPNPTQPNREPRKRGTRVPRDFSITEEMRSWAKKETPLVDLDAKLGEWIDYWTGAPNGVKVDWISTWRNGMRKQQEFAERGRLTVPKKISPQDEWKYR